MSPLSPHSYPLSAAQLADIVRASVPRQLPTATSDQADRTGSACVAIGAFDGVHLGHRELIGACVAEARERGQRSVVVTFDPDPSELIEGARAARRLLEVPDRVSLCRSLGAREVVTLPFTTDLAALTPERFVDLLFREVGPISCIHVGANFHFGARGSGTTATLRRLGDERGFDVVIHELCQLGGESVSSTRIRRLLGQGKVGEATELLGRHHFVRGRVAHGRGEGTSFGFPTANVCCDERSCLPGEGVYACAVTDGVHAWPAAANVGAPPTFGERRDAFLEANLIGFSGDLYGSTLSVVFLEWLRASRPFPSLEELERTVLGNIAWVSRNVGSSAVEVSHDH